MRFAVRFSVSAVAGCLGALLLAACGGGDGTGPTSGVPAELVGSWAADGNCVADGCGLTLHSTSNAADTINLVAQGLASVYLTLSGNGAAQLQLLSPVNDTTVAGTARAESGNLIISGGGAADTVGYVLDGSLLRLSFREESAWSFHGTTVPATVTAALEKR